MAKAISFCYNKRMEKQAPETNKKIDKNRNVRRIFIALFLVASAFFAVWFVRRDCCASPGTVKDAAVKGYLSQIKISALSYYNSNSNYVGFDKSEDYSKIVVKATKKESSCSAQISEKTYCVKAKLSFSYDDGKNYWCVDSTYQGRVADDHCTSKKPYCTELPSLPQGYTFNKYSVEKELEVACQKHSDCAVPAEYSIQSRCPFVSLCLDDRCAVVCPSQGN